ncbi:hypothetical protein H4582DRAFT_2053848 [Lactarius indigo]|nr:hypothetical protein H4582DRAFT_2053848 [Lactarius indigo]
MCDAVPLQPRSFTNHTLYVDDTTLSWINYLLAQHGTPRTSSTSYGTNQHVLSPVSVRAVNILVGDGDGKETSIPTPSSPHPVPGSLPSEARRTHSLEVTASTPGGGFLHLGYQDGAIATLLQSLSSCYDGLYNSSGRGIPDISAQALNFEFVCHEESKL